MPSSSHYESDLALARSMADDADAISFARFGAADLVVESKPDLTPVSDADKAVEQALRTRLAQARPDDAIVGEEFGAEPGAAGAGARRWVIDPIDGTKNYVRGVPVWATLISLLNGDDVVVGVVSAPALGRRWWAARDGGAWVSLFGGEPRRISVSRVGRLEDASFSYASLGSAGEGWGPRREAFLALLDRFWRTRAYGDFWSYMLVAEGAVDAAAEAELALWDMGALAPIVTEAGGRFSGVNGVDGIHQGNAVASNGLLHDAVLDALRV